MTKRIFAWLLSVRPLLLPVLFGLGGAFFLYQGASKYFPHYYEALIFASLGMGLFAWTVHRHGWTDWRSICAWFTITVFHGLSGEANVTSHADSDQRIAHAATATSASTDNRLATEKAEAAQLQTEIEDLAAEAAALHASATFAVPAREAALRDQLEAARAGMAAELAAGGAGPRYRSHEAAATAASAELAAMAPQIQQREAHAAELAAAVAAIEAKVAAKQARADSLATSLAALAAASQSAEAQEMTVKADSKLLFAFAQFAANGNDLGSRAIVFAFFFFVYGSWELINAALISRLRFANLAQENCAPGQSGQDDPIDPARKPLPEEKSAQLELVPREVSPPAHSLLPYNEKCKKRLLQIVGLPGDLMCLSVDKVHEGLLADPTDKVIRRVNRYEMLDRYYAKREIDAMSLDEFRAHLRYAFRGQPGDRRIGDILVEAAAAMEQRENRKKELQHAA